MRPTNPFFGAGHDWKKSVLTLLLTLWLGLATQMTLFTPTVLASTNGILPDGTLLRHANTVIGPNQVVEEVVVVGHDVTVEGTVTDNLIVINGNIHLTETAKTGLVMDIGGQVTTSHGAKVRNVVSLWFRGPFQNSLAVGSVGLLVVWVIRIIISAFVLVMPVIVSFLIKPWLLPIKDYLGNSARKTGLAGLFTMVLAVGLAMLFATTIIGLPIAVVVVCVYGLMGLVGLSAASVWIGDMATHGQVYERPLWLQSLIGATLLMAFANVPLFGTLLLLLIWLLGSGAVSFFLMAQWRRWRTTRRMKRA